MKEDAQKNNEDQDLVLWKNDSNRSKNIRMSTDWMGICSMDVKP